jgi:hypothetical protein
LFTKNSFQGSLKRWSRVNIIVDSPGGSQGPID